MGCHILSLAASVIVGQEGLLLTLCLAGAFRLAETRRDMAVGLLSALCTAKPHVFLRVPLALIAHRRWRIVSAVVGAVAPLIAGTAAAGKDWPMRWMAVARTLAPDTRLNGDVEGVRPCFSSA